MGDEEKKRPSDSRSRYVWDPKKLAWVETAVDQEAVKEKPSERPPKEEIIPQEEDVAAQASGQSSKMVQEETAAMPVAVEALEEVGGLKYRGAWIRLGAIIIDLIILSVIWLIITRIPNVPVWGELVLGLLYFVGFWTWRGQTPGKMVIGARIVKTDGTSIGIGNAILRYIFYLVPAHTPIFYFVTYVDFISKNFAVIVLLVAVVSIIVIAVSSNKRGIHDLIAGTVVINTRSSVVQPHVIAHSDTDEAVTEQQD